MTNIRGRPTRRRRTTTARAVAPSALAGGLSLSLSSLSSSSSSSSSSSPLPTTVALLLLALTSTCIPTPATATCGGGLLNCRHGSTCTKGDANYTFLNSFPHLPFLSTTNVQGEHCDCPSDRTAVDCGTKMVVCDLKTGFSCFDNGECGMTKHGKKPLCDCTTAHKDGRVLFAGTHCEFEATAVCDVSGDGLDVDRWFCANNGTCRMHESNINKKCSCPTGWTGPHCEYPSESETSPKIENCTLQCSNGGQCKFGSKDHGSHKGIAITASWDNQIENMHCICPDGYAGVKCDVRVEECKGSGVGANMLRCYHGGTCIDAEDVAGGSSSSSSAMCDCSTAIDWGKTYAGRFCEHVATTTCPPVEGKKDSSMFCTNGGECNLNEPHKGCDCSNTNHEGPLCEYAPGTEPECTLQCLNGGQCRHGINPDVSGILGTKFDISLKTNSGFMHCSCPEGTIGVDCGTRYEICGPKEEMHHACLNGGKCIIIGQNQNGKNKYSCDCGEMNPFAGQHCEHSATVFCAKSEEGASASYHSFCTNGGKCADTITPEEVHPGCICPQEYEGDHCQYKFGTSPALEVSSSSLDKSSSPSQGGNGRPRAATIGIAIAVTLLAVLAIGAIFVHTRMRRMANRSGSGGGGVLPGVGVNLAPAASSFDAEDNRPRAGGSVRLDGQMHDVEII